MRFRVVAGLLVILGVVTPAGWLSAQSLAAPAVAIAYADSRSRAMTSASYWHEGAVIGAALLGTTGALVWYELGCHSEIQSDCSLGNALLGGALSGFIGGTLGGLIGGAFPAPKPRPLRGQLKRSTLIGASTGALLSFGLISRFCVNGCQSSEVSFGISTTAIGALAGLLVSR